MKDVVRQYIKTNAWDIVILVLLTIIAVNTAIIAINSIASMPVEHCIDGETYIEFGNGAAKADKPCKF